MSDSKDPYAKHRASAAKIKARQKARREKIKEVTALADEAGPVIKAFVDNALAGVSAVGAIVPNKVSGIATAVSTLKTIADGIANQFPKGEEKAPPEPVKSIPPPVPTPPPPPELSLLDRLIAALAELEKP